MYSQKIDFRTYSENDSHSLNGCYTFALVNQGNKAVTINGNLVLLPGASWSDTNSNPDIRHDEIISFQFDKTSPITDVAGKPGVTPTGNNRANTADTTAIYRLVFIIARLQKL